MAGPGEESQRARLRRESHRDLASIVGKILGKGPIELAGNGSYSLIENARGEFGFSVVFHSDESYFGYLWFTDEAPHQVVEATGFPNDALNQQVLELTRSKAAIFAARNDDPDSSTHYPSQRPRDKTPHCV